MGRRQRGAEQKDGPKGMIWVPNRQYRDQNLTDRQGRYASYLKREETGVPEKERGGWTEE